MESEQKPQRIQLSRRKGWRMPDNTIKVDRSTKWGNPFVRHGDGIAMSKQMAVASFRSLLLKEGCWWSTPLPWPAGKIPAGPPTTLDDVRKELRGKNLACWCPIGSPCHADALIEFANKEGPNDA